MSADVPFRLRALPAFTRLGLTGVAGVLLLGFWAAVTYIRDHYENRDTSPGITMDDLRAAYAGLERPSPLVTALEDGHPEDLADTDREILLTWLRSDRVTEDYDNLDLGDMAPAEVIDYACLSCHAKNAEEGGGIWETVPLDTWPDVKNVAFSLSVEGTPPEIMRISTHTHALALAAITVAVGILLLCTRWPGFVRHGLLGLAGIALLGDLGGMWLATQAADFVWLVAIAGACYSGSMVLSILAIVADLWLPGGRAPATDPRP
jgi:hypothetical protein